MVRPVRAAGDWRSARCSRSGAKRRYNDTTRERILTKLDEPPPAGYASWNGALLAKALGDVSAHQVWRVLRTQSIHLQRWRSRCISTDPQFGPKAADIVGLYLHPLFILVRPSSKPGRGAAHEGSLLTARRQCGRRNLLRYSLSWSDGKGISGAAKCFCVKTGVIGFE